jgi:hypothetical protein
MKLFVILGCLFAVSFSRAQGVDPQTSELAQPLGAAALAPGQSRDDVIQLIGEPKVIYEPQSGKHFPEEERLSVLETLGSVDDVYEEHFGGIEFEMRIVYTIDTSTSRLHPTHRVLRVIFIPDKNLPFWTLVGLISQAKSLCATDCSMLGEISGNSYDVYVYPQLASEDQRLMAAAVASGFSSSRGPVGYAPLPCIDISFQERRGVNDRSPLPEFNSLTVDQIDLGVCDPAFEKRTTRDGVKELFHLTIP